MGKPDNPAHRELEMIASEARSCAAYYQDHPGHFGPEAGVDLYITIARLADALLSERSKQP